MRYPGWMIMRPMLLAAAMGLVLGSMSGCAAIFRGDKQSVRVVTDPPGATLEVDGISYVTPASVVLKRNEPHTVTITKDGYQGVTFKLMANWDAGGALAVVSDIIIPGGSVLFAVDTLVGADRQFYEMATIKLDPAQGPPSEPTLVYEHKGKLFNKTDYDQVVAHDSFFGRKSPRGSPPTAAETAQKPPALTSPAQAPTAGASGAPAIPE
jgi:hypothetical protein